MANEIAERYAQGLYELAKENNSLKEKKEQCEKLLMIQEENPEIQLFFRAVKVTAEEKKELIQTVFGEYVDIDLVHFLQLLVDKGRMGYLSAMLRTFIQYVNEGLGIQEATVYSARTIGDNDMERLRMALEKQTGKTVVLKNKIDDKLIAGIKVVVGNRVTDISMKHQIDTLKTAILKGGQA